MFYLKTKNLKYATKEDFFFFFVTKEDITAIWQQKFVGYS